MEKFTEIVFDASNIEELQLPYLEVLKSRKSSRQARFSDHLSIEAQIAMQQAFEDMENSNSANDKGGHSHQSSDNCDSKTKRKYQTSFPQRNAMDSMNSEYVSSEGDSSAVLQYLCQNKESSNSLYSLESSDSHYYGTKPDRLQGTRFSDVYQYRNSPRMSGDVTDVNYDPKKERRQGLGGVKVESAMEITEIVCHGDKQQEQQEDEQTLQLQSLQNSLEKVAVWMDVAVNSVNCDRGSYQQDEDHFSIILSITDDEEDVESAMF